ncbi:hypothetical protein QQF64_022836 [Cirrhinus molitorella]|uniref:Uncharacterized protein n=1 Tax=Cirrhinus molitorella TaxID=172907 RepID=A0ABR3L3H2_9TELE
MYCIRKRGSIKAKEGGEKRCRTLYDSSMNGGGEGSSHSMTIPMMATIHRHRKCLTSHPERRQQQPACVKGVIGYNYGLPMKMVYMLAATTNIALLIPS